MNAIDNADARAVARGACRAVRADLPDVPGEPLPSLIRDILDRAVRALDAWEAGGG